MTNMYYFIDRLSKNTDINRHADNLNGVRITVTGNNFPVDGDAYTYRGKLYWCSIFDLFRRFDMMQVNTDDFTPPNYPFAKYALKNFGQLNFQYTTIGSVEKAYRSLIDMLRPMKSGIPMPPHVFLLAEVLSDYGKDMSWYKQYLEFIGEFAGVVKSSIHSNVVYRLHIERFFKQLETQGMVLSNK